MLNILFISYDVKEAISWYRCSGIAENLERQIEHKITIAQWNEIPTMTWHDFIHWKYDIVYFSRPFTKDVLNFLSYAKMFGKKVWTDFDVIDIVKPILNIKA